MRQIDRRDNTTSHHHHHHPTTTTSPLLERRLLPLSTSSCYSFCSLIAILARSVYPLYHHFSVVLLLLLLRDKIAAPCFYDQEKDKPHALELVPLLLSVSHSASRRHGQGMHERRVESAFTSTRERKTKRRKKGKTFSRRSLSTESIRLPLPRSSGLEQQESSRISIGIG